MSDLDPNANQQEVEAGPIGATGEAGPAGPTGPMGPAGKDGICTCSPDALKALEARVTFLEAWLHVPVIHLPGYVAPEPVAEPTEDLPVEGE